MSFRSTKHLVVLLCSLFLFVQCEKEYVCPVPDITKFSFDVIIPTYDVMTAQMKANVGYKSHGILVYCHYEGEVYAYDATCVNSSECVERGVIRFDGVGKPTATCRRCSSQYYLLDGKHLKEKLLLRQYGVQKVPYTNSGQYKIFN
ncbi:MAG: hypothetical protein ACRC9X_02160 [Bacteroidales bacterium]